MSVTVLYDSADLLVLHKPTGWLVHPAGTDAPDLLAWCKRQGFSDYAPAHRLDLGTSGPVAFGRHAVLKELGQAFATEQAEKTYQALVFGNTRPKGRISRKLSDTRKGSDLKAVTRYKTLKQYGKKASLLELKPETGRKHQIRRHLQGIGHAIVGDDRYRPRGKPTVPAFPGRLWLHCTELSILGETIQDPIRGALAAHLVALDEWVAAKAKPAS